MMLTTTESRFLTRYNYKILINDLTSGVIVEKFKLGIQNKKP